MRLEVTLAASDDKDIRLPLHYNRAVQGLIYHLIGDYLPDLHDKGYVMQGRAFRMFVFSRILGEIKGRSGEAILFGSPIKVKISSLIPSFLELMGNRLLQAQGVNLSACQLQVDSVSIKKNPDFSAGAMIIRTLSPITVYSTLTTGDGRKKTYYYHPREKEFAEQIAGNIFKKAMLLGISTDGAAFQIEPYKICSGDRKTMYYNDFLITGWMGQYKITTSAPELFSIAYDAGLGAKNSQGFGMIEKVVDIR
jgi:CRISPR-associated endoribonuclease Cas6